MNQLQKAAGILGALLLAASVFLIARDERQFSRGGRRRSEEKPVDALAEDLKEAWAVYHNR